jgi:hypothetical protein
MASSSSIKPENVAYRLRISSGSGIVTLNPGPGPTYLTTGGTGDWEFVGSMGNTTYLTGTYNAQEVYAYTTDGNLLQASSSIPTGKGLTLAVLTAPLAPNTGLGKSTLIVITGQTLTGINISQPSYTSGGSAIDIRVVPQIPPPTPPQLAASSKPVTGLGRIPFVRDNMYPKTPVQESSGPSDMGLPTADRFLVNQINKGNQDEAAVIVVETKKKHKKKTHKKHH